jgi:hypothetical protein
MEEEILERLDERGVVSADNFRFFVGGSNCLQKADGDRINVSTL